MVGRDEKTKHNQQRARVVLTSLILSIYLLVIVLVQYIRYTLSMQRLIFLLTILTLVVAQSQNASSISMYEPYNDLNSSEFQQILESIPPVFPYFVNDTIKSVDRRPLAKGYNYMLNFHNNPISCRPVVLIFVDPSGKANPISFDSPC